MKCCIPPTTLYLDPPPKRDNLASVCNNISEDVLRKDDSPSRPQVEQDRTGETE